MKTQYRIQNIFPARNVGHTRLMVEGLEHFTGRCVLVAHTREWAAQLAEEISLKNPNIAIEPRGLDDPPLRGVRLPEAIDNSALLQLFNDALSEFNGLQDQIKQLKRALANKTPQT